MARESPQSQDDLRREAMGLLRRLRLMKLVREVGKAWVVGSVPLKLIVKPDIDVHVLVERGGRATLLRSRRLPPRHAARREPRPPVLSAEAAIDAPEVPAALAIAKQLMERGVTKLDLLRFYFRDAVKIGFDSRVCERTWHIDVWVTTTAEHLGVGPTRWVRRRLTPELRQAILKLKRYYAGRDMCRYGMSHELYRAVIKGGVRTPRQFLEYARTHELNYTDVLRMLEADAKTWRRPPKRRTRHGQ